MFRFPDPPTGGPRPGQPGDRGPRLPLPFAKVGPLAMLLFLGVVLLSVFLLGRVDSDRGMPAAQTPAGQPDLMGREPKLERLDDGELAAQYPTMVREELQNDIFAWFQQPGRGTISDRAATFEPEWVQWFLSDDVRPRLERLPGWVFGDLGDVERVVDEPGPHRGKLVQAWGAVRSIDEVQLPTTPATRAWRIRLDDPSGAAWTVLSARAAPEGTVPGSWLKTFGAFVKLEPIEEGRPSFVVFSAQHPLASFPPAAFREIQTEWAAEVDDERIEGSQRQPGDEEPFWKLMNYVRTMGAAGYRAKVASGELKVTDLTSTRGASDLAQHPSVHRFELVRLRVGVSHGEGGFVLQQDLPENVGGIRSVLRGFVVDDQGRILWVMTPFPAETFRLGDARLALIEGFFYKRKAVETKDGKAYWMPVIVATSITAIDTSKPPTNYVAWTVWIVLVGSLGCAVLWIVLLLRNRRSAEETRRRHLERIARRTGHAPPPVA